MLFFLCLENKKKNFAKLCRRFRTADIHRPTVRRSLKKTKHASVLQFLLLLFFLLDRRRWLYVSRAFTFRRWPLTFILFFFFFPNSNRSTPSFGPAAKSKLKSAAAIFVKRKTKNNQTHTHTHANKQTANFWGERFTLERIAVIQL